MKPLGKDKKLVEEAYNVSIPVIRDIIKAAPAAAAEDAGKIDSWIKQNPPQNNLVAPGLPQIEIQKQLPTEKKPAAAPVQAEKPPVADQAEKKPASEETAG